ncbi:GntR family transcriptional regulator [Pseudoroseomonas globiformis]|uniref:GntR family transcriptional regulator n=1 Tax=Teichococcus globiformis TaxID=2307229 RepID=A0ABV7G6X6_9PROT
MLSLDPLPDALPALPPTLQPIGPRKSAADFAYGALRRAIIDLELAPGMPLSRAELAQRLGLSQTPVREALIRLEGEGLVEVVPSASTRVSLIDLDTAREALFLRRAVEAEVVREVARQPREALGRQLRTSLERQAGLLAEQDHRGLTEADTEFHGLFHEAAGMAGLWTMIGGRSGHLDRLRRLHLPSPGKGTAILREHGALAAAILAGDAAGAEATLRAHLADTLSRVTDIVALHPAFFPRDPA